jgi:hypothetical protein
LTLERTLCKLRFSEEFDNDSFSIVYTGDDFVHRHVGGCLWQEATTAGTATTTAATTCCGSATAATADAAAGTTGAAADGRGDLCAEVARSAEC